MKQVFRLVRQFFLRLLAHRASTDQAFLDDLVIIAPHPDDEVLGCGGLIAKAVAAGQSVKVVILTSGGAAHNGCCAAGERLVEERRRELAREALEYLGLSAEHIVFLDWQDGKLPRQQDADFAAKANELASLLVRFNPSAVFCPHPFEEWSDHIAAEEMTRAALDQSRLNVTLYHYCVWFWYSLPLRKAFHCDWRNALTLDISKVYRRKQAAISAYMAPCAPCGNPWSGKLPKEFMRAFLWKKELFFKFVV